ncbi:RidA family protein [Aureimonas populi]|uniref:RidA family protein n=1 Tax=Aureimonas populi TaxID=1701758 RepID=A0ABW5CIX2_9HYPH|nr:RidA family protein [Aureimonas populi]
MVNRILQTPIMHRIVEHNGIVFLGGLIADDLSQSMGGQTAQICQKLDKLLAEAGTDKSKLLSAMLYVTDMSQKGEMNEAWTSWIEAPDLPTRATIGVADLGKNVLIEIVVTAAR